MLLYIVFSLLYFASYHKCCSLCGNLLPYDGLDDCLLNMGRFLVHYEVLRDYMFQFFHSRYISRIYGDLGKDKNEYMCI